MKREELRGMSNEQLLKCADDCLEKQDDDSAKQLREDCIIEYAARNFDIKSEIDTEKYRKFLSLSEELREFIEGSLGSEYGKDAVDFAISCLDCVGIVRVSCNYEMFFSGKSQEKIIEFMEKFGSFGVDSVKIGENDMPTISFMMSYRK